MKKKVVIIIALALSVILALTLFAGCAKTTDSAFSQGMIAVQKDGLWGFADESGDIVIDCKYDSVSPFYGKYAAVQMGSKRFLIDADGNDTGIELGSASVTANEDRTLIAATEKYTGLEGVLSTESGEWVIRAAYDEIEFLEGGLVKVGLVKVDSASDSHFGNYGLFNAAGAEICPVEYEDVEFGANAVIMVKQEQGEMTADVFAVDGSIISEDVKITRVDKTDGGLVYYEYTTPATDTAAEKVNQVVPGLNRDTDIAVSEVIDGTASVYVTKDTATSGEGAVTVTYSVFKADGTSLFSGLTKEPIYRDGVLQVDKTEAEATVPSYTYVDMINGSMLENIPNGIVTGGEFPAINFMRLPDDSLYYTLDGKIYAMDSTSPVFTGAEDESQIVVRAEGVFEETSETGVVKIYNGATAIFEIGVGQEMGYFTSDGAYFTVKNAEGYMALYKNDGTQLFGFDKKITDVSFAG